MNAKFLFTCSNRECQCLNEKLGLHFFTIEMEEAEKHSRENNSPMWVSKHSEEEINGMYDSIKILK